MPRDRAEPKSHSVLVKAAGVAVAVALHLAVLAAILASSPIKPEIELPETVEVRFVEIGDELVDAAANADSETEPVQEVAAIAPEPVVEPVPDPVVQPEPEPEPEPLVQKPDPETIQPEPKPDIKRLNQSLSLNPSRVSPLPSRWSRRR